MTEAQKILSLIESVDPADTAGMDEIDARVWCYIKNTDYLGFKCGVHACQAGNGSQCFFWPENYTKSRDALKKIRPDGYISWSAPDTSYKNKVFGKYFEGCCMSSKRENYKGDLPTEELAELYAIISAIDYERSQK